jgi:hypothetical protein
LAGRRAPGRRPSRRGGSTHRLAAGAVAHDAHRTLDDLPFPGGGLDDEETGADLDEGYSPGERPLSLSAWGTTAAEESTHESLGRRLSREEPDLGTADDEGDGLVTPPDTDGELIDDQVGDRRAGRLGRAGLDAADPRSDYWATDIGIDGAGASAEESAVHVVPDDESDY